MIFWLFRTNLTNLESYHQYDNIKDFKMNLWDFYLLQGLWLLENTECEEVSIWRLTKRPSYGVKFKFGGKVFIQRFVRSFDECFKYKKPDVTFFRGGFSEYDRLTKKNPKFFGTKLYLGANGPRRYPIYGGIYDKILIEDERDIKKDNHYPFYKIGVPNIFKPLNLQKKYDICWIANGTQIKQKGQEYFIEYVSKSNVLKNAKILHIGNKPDVGKKLCDKYGVDNIDFTGHYDRFGVNKALNQSKFGLVTSNDVDGCPRISTEILATGTPLLIRDKTRLLRYYRDLDFVKTFSDNNLEKIYEEAKKNYEEMRQKNLNALESELNLDNIMRMNIRLWEE